MTTLPFRLMAIGTTLALSSLILAATSARPAFGQHGHGAAGTGSPAAPPAERSAGGVRISMDELHRAGGVPPGWRFSWPAGDARKGREVYAKLECYQCHEVKGESFPPVAQDPTRRGPALSGMGAHHPAEYFAEAILNPNAVIVTGDGYTGPDGLSIMPDFRDSLTLAETLDLVAYIRSLTGGDDQAHHHKPAAAEHERAVGNYHVRLAYAASAGSHGSEHHGQHQHGAGAPAAHLMVFISDTTLGQPVPYLPVTARIEAGGAAPRVVRLSPMLGGRGFYYGANVTLPAATKKITVSIGKPTLKVMPAASSRFARGVEASFDWGK
jgi:mono/diheme cytochrome c family protein